jgi:integration host factor subunit beta
MTKAELVEAVAVRLQLTQRQTDTLVDILLQCITEALQAGEKVELRGFGSFRVRSRQARLGRNPKTGAVVPIPAKKIPFFKAGKALRMLGDAPPIPRARSSRTRSTARARV